METCSLKGMSRPPPRIQAKALLLGCLLRLTQLPWIVAGVINFGKATIVRTAEHHFDERLNFFNAEMHDGPDRVGEGVRCHRDGAIGEAAAGGGFGWDGKIEGVGAVVLEIGFDADMFVEEVRDGGSGAVQGEVGDVGIFGEAEIGIINGELEGGVALREEGWGEEDDDG